MRRTLLERGARRARGFNLIELVISIVVTGIVVAGLAYFVFPVRQAADIAVRAELTDTADTALQRIGRDVRLALPNSVRTTTSGGAVFVEFLAVRTAGRYRGEGGGAAGGVNCPNDDPSLTPPDNDQLSFDSVADSCFKTIGKLPDAASVAPTDYLVLNNYGPGFAGQDAYSAGPPVNRALITSIDTSEAGRDRVAFAATTFQRTLHDSPGRRFFIISGPVSYVCDPVLGTITRYWGYPIAAAQPTTFGSGSSAVIATKVSACDFDYAPNVAPQIGLLTLRLTLSAPTSSGVAETVSLYHAIHVNNVP
ncbi:MAG: prepilin-type N-terminal cleavage/methylation domain-containing protein [Burkholderiales bacterium]